MNRDCYARGTERYRKTNKEYYKNNLEKCRQQLRNSLIRRRGAEGKVTLEEWEGIKDDYNHRCLCCKRKEPKIKLTQDHVLPLSKGGTNTIDNIQPLCIDCNKSKFTKYIDYRMEKI